ncbi:hypothetical protein CRG98_016203 [Punica granatum]|uniref:Uncharacterized protein n=1 Tax=Punica granatum TaxID=22663 RepID=A0A2I0K4B6_PUNGR|nr:hypothetical protein CRG98_016203 [Punica granatum]
MGFVGSTCGPPSWAPPAISFQEKFSDGKEEEWDGIPRLTRVRGAERADENRNGNKKEKICRKIVGPNGAAKWDLSEVRIIFSALVPSQEI